MRLTGDDRLDDWVTEMTAAALAGVARSSAVDLGKQGVWARPTGAYRLRDVVGLAVIGAVRAHLTADELLGVGRAMAAASTADELTDRVKAHARSAGSLLDLPDPAAIDEAVCLVVAPRIASVTVANGHEDLGRKVWRVQHPVQVYRTAPVLIDLLNGFNGQARTGTPPTVRARGRPRKAEVIRLVR